MVAPLSLAISCLASVHARQETATARDLFLGSRYLLGVMMEIDNAESRSPDLIMAVCTVQLGSHFDHDAYHLLPWSRHYLTLFTEL